MASLKLLVTGAAGFVGARFVEQCNALGHAVVSSDDPSHFKTRPEHRGVDFGKIIDRAELVEHLSGGSGSSQEFDGIVHLGACTDTTEFDVDYLNRVNLEYTKSLWRYATERGIPFVYASSAATYGDGSLGYADDEASIPNLAPLNPYGRSKQDFDVWALAREKEGIHPPHWAGFKFFNVYGFGERHKEKMASVIMHAFDQISTTGTVRLFKSHRQGIEHGHQKRDFVFVDDVVDVLFFALAKPIRRGIFNLGSGRARTYEDLARAVFQAMKRPENIEYIDMPLEIRDKYQYFTEAKMEKLTREGYERKFTSLERGVERYVTKLTEVNAHEKQ